MDPQDEQQEKSTFLITNIQRFSVNDGPGIRTTVFLKGCPLNCAWCHNPESIHPYQEFFFDEEKCVSCGACAKVCPEGAIRAPVERKVKKEPAVTPIISSSGSILDKIKDGTFGDESIFDNFKEYAHRSNIAQEIADSDFSPPEFDYGKCTHCMQCVQACSHKALSAASQPKTLDEVYSTVVADKIFYKSSGGGLTLSGGEPLLQPKVTRALLKRAHEDGIHTALDTTGFAKWDTIASLLPYVDLVLFDLKVMDDLKHKKWTGVSNKLILENIQKIAATGTKIRIRCVIVHSINFWDLEHARGLAKFAATLGDSVTGIDIIPFHNFADKKYERLGRKYYFKGFPNIFKEEVEDYRQIMEENCPWRPTIGGLIGTEQKTEDTAAA